MPTPFNIFVVLSDTINEQINVAIDDWLDLTSEFFSSFNFLLPFYQVKYLEDSISNFSNLPSRILFRLGRKTFAAPPEFKNRVIRLDKAVELTYQELLDCVNALDPRIFPVTTRSTLMQQNWTGIKKRVASWFENRFLLSPAEKFLKKWILPLFSGPAKAYQKLYQLISFLVTTFVTITALLLVANFLLGFDKDRWLKASLGQSAPRKKLKLVGGGKIRRREPGGSPP